MDGKEKLEGPPLFGEWLERPDSQNLVLHRKTDVEAGEVQSIHPIRVLLVGWAGVVRQNAQQRLPLIQGNPGEQF